MGLLVKGRWRDEWYNTDSTGGEFVREDSQFRDRIASGSRFPPQAGRYHLYVSLACPWAHRTLILRSLKQLDTVIGVSVVSPIMLENGWTYRREEGSTGDAVNGVDYHYQLYTRHQADYSGRVTVPVLWDCESDCIVNNESADIVRIFNSAFDELTGNRDDYYPADWRAEIDRVNERVYSDVNNGVYRCGFATKQHAYDRAYDKLFAALDWLEGRLQGSRFVAGERITEADWRLFTTLIRFDAVYHGHFKCNRQRLQDFPALAAYLRELYQWPGVAASVDFQHIKTHYYGSHRTINPSGIVPLGPAIDYRRPHRRESLPGYDAAGTRLSG